MSKSERHFGAALIAGALIAAALALPANAANLSSSECQSLWKQIDTSGSGSVSQSQAQPYVTNFKSVDTNSDGKLSSAEFTAGCNSGMVHNPGSSGAAGGTSGSSSSGSSSSGSSSMPKR